MLDPLSLFFPANHTFTFLKMEKWNSFLHSMDNSRFQSSCQLTTLPRSTLLLPLTLSALQISGNLCLSDFPWLRSADVLPFCGSLGMLWAEWAGQDQFIYHAGYVTGCDWAQMIIIVAGKAHPVVAFQHTHTHRTIATIKNETTT